jgi:hypothetical protein
MPGLGRLHGFQALPVWEPCNMRVVQMPAVAGGRDAGAAPQVRIDGAAPSDQLRP